VLETAVSLNVFHQSLQPERKQDTTRFTKFYHTASCILKKSSVTQNIKSPKSQSSTAAFMSHVQTVFMLKTEK